MATDEIADIGTSDEARAAALILEAARFRKAITREVLTRRVPDCRARAILNPRIGRSRGGKDTGYRMSQQTTIRKLAELVNTPVEKLLEQLAEAGMTFSGPDQVVTSAEKPKLLGFLKRSHGKTEAAADRSSRPARSPSTAAAKQEITVGGGQRPVKAPPSTWWCARKSPW